MVADPAVDRLVAVGRFLEIQNLGLNLPFLLGFLWLATDGAPSLRETALLVVAFVAARNAGHSFNRWADRDLDARNPRTSDRLLVRRPALAPYALVLALAMAGLLGICAYWLNPLALLLVPVALAVVLGYSYTKRLSSLTTLFLGLVEAITPAAVYVGVTGELPLAAIVAVVAMFAWGTSFETIHSLGDLESDRRLGLRSLPERLGPERTRPLLFGTQALALAAFLAYGRLAGAGWGFALAVGAMALGAGLLDTRLRAPGGTRTAFRGHFVLAAVFLVGALVGFVA